MSCEEIPVIISWTAMSVSVIFCDIVFTQCYQPGLDSGLDCKILNTSDVWWKFIPYLDGLPSKIIPIVFSLAVVVLSVSWS